MLFGGAIQNAIFLYIILVIVLFILKPKLLEQKDENGNYLKKLFLTLKK